MAELRHWRIGFTATDTSVDVLTEPELNKSGGL